MNAKDNLKTQDEVLGFFKRHPGALFTVYEVGGALPHIRTNTISSAITLLTRKGFLVKTRVQQRGPHGYMNHCWELNDGSPDI